MGRPPVIFCFKCDVCGEQYRISDKHKCRKQKRSITIKGYTTYTELSKEILDTIKVGDLVKINDWKKPMKVRGVSPNYAVITENNFGTIYYSVIEKKQRTAGQHNAMRPGFFHCGKDDYIFGATEFQYKFEDAEAVAKYLAEFEIGETHLSERTAIPILELSVKQGVKQEGQA